jgi:hypothetical protein
MFYKLLAGFQVLNFDLAIVAERIGAFDHRRVVISRQTAIRQVSGVVDAHLWAFPHTGQKLNGKNDRFFFLPSK